jgi:hypothetical protein
MSNAGATVARLRNALTHYFERELIDTVLRRMREAGVIEAGRPGRNGAGSAQIDPRQAALVLIALGSGADPISAPAAAERIGDFRCRAIDHTHTSDPNPRREHLDGLSGITFLEFLTGELGLVRGGLPGYEPTGWNIDGHEASQLAPDRLVFGGLPRNEVVRRITVIPSRLIRDVAAIFPAREPIPHDAEQHRLAAWVVAAFEKAKKTQTRKQNAPVQVCAGAADGD